jgi:NAD(P)-dependent dehydrogenase (short-subunit alcohol dehydrogenase family)
MNPRPMNVVVTGGSSGLGAACVERFAMQGATGVIADLQPPGENCSSLALQRFLYQSTDVTDESSLRSALRLATEKCGPLRAVVACAGILHAERILSRSGPASLTDFRRVIEISLCGTFNLLRLAAEVMQSNAVDAEGQRGVIVTTASIAAFDGQVGQVAYAAAKGGVAALTLPAARELGRWGIRVVCIAPGVFDTAMMQAAPAELRESLVSQTPFPARLGRAEEFAALVEHILENPMLNGTVLRLDGALRLGMR